MIAMTMIMTGGAIAIPPRGRRRRRERHGPRITQSVFLLKRNKRTPKLPQIHLQPRHCASLARESIVAAASQLPWSVGAGRGAC